MSTELSETIEKQERERLNVTYWAGVLIWAGLIFGADSLGLLPRLGGMDAWNWVFTGAGLFALVLLTSWAARADRPRTRKWSWVWGVALVILGLSGLTSPEIGFPLILLLIGAVLLGTALFQR